MLARNLSAAVYGCVLAWLAIEVCRFLGLRLAGGFRTADAQQRAQTWQAVSLSFLISVLGSFAATWAERMLRSLGFDHALIVGLDQRSSIGVSGVPDSVLKFGMTVAIEVIVIVAATATLLAAARRPTWQIYSVIGLAEVVLHAYMGVPAITMIFYAAGRVWLFRRHGGFVPLVIGHAAFNLTMLVKWSAPSPYVVVIDGLFVLAAVAGVAQRSAPPIWAKA